MLTNDMHVVGNLDTITELSHVIQFDPETSQTLAVRPVLGAFDSTDIARGPNGQMLVLGHFRKQLSPFNDILGRLVTQGPIQAQQSTLVEFDNTFNPVGVAALGGTSRDVFVVGAPTVFSSFETPPTIRKIDVVTGTMSTFANLPLDVTPTGMTLDADGDLLVAGRQGTSALRDGVVIEVDRNTGVSTNLANLGSAFIPDDLVVTGSGNILVTGTDTSAQTNGLLLSVDAWSGVANTIFEFENYILTQGYDPLGIDVTTTGEIFVAGGTEFLTTEFGRVFKLNIGAGSATLVKTVNFLPSGFSLGEQDSDGDGLYDIWEEHGLDADLNGTVDVDLPTFGANPLHKDIFLELDYMSVSGQSTGGNTNLTLVDATQNWDENRWQGLTVHITEGTGKDQVRTVISNTATELVIGEPFIVGHDPPKSRPWDTIPDESSKYELLTLPSAEQIDLLVEAFAEAPETAGGLENPDGLKGINLWIDTGGATNAAGDPIGFDFGGGEQLPFTNISGLTSDFYATKNANFDPDRELVFRYAISGELPTNNEGTSTGGNSSTLLFDTTQNWSSSQWQGRQVTITGGKGAGQTREVVSNNSTTLLVNFPWFQIPDHTSTYEIELIGGQAEVGGNDFIEYTQQAGVLMHELGHTLNLRHGGHDNHTCKPNYLSVMVFPIPQADGSILIDYSPPRHSGGRGDGPLPTLDEEDLDETHILDSSDADNMLTLKRGEEDPIPVPINAPIDWDGDGVIETDIPPMNIDISRCPGNADDFHVLEGHDDWSNIVLPFRLFGNAFNAPLNAATDPDPTLKEIREFLEKLLRTDVEISISDSPDPVDQGEELTYELTVTNHGPITANGIVVNSVLPDGVDFVSISADRGTVSGTDTAELGSLQAGSSATVQIVTTALVPGTAVFTSTVEFDGTDSNEDNNSDSAETTILNVPPEIASLTVTPMIDENGTVTLTGSFTDPGTRDEHHISVDWKDGTTTEIDLDVGERTFEFEHQYVDDNPTNSIQDPYSIDVIVSDNHDGSDNDSVTTIVKNVNPTIDSILSSARMDNKARVDDTVTVSGTFSDIGTQDTYTARIEWGDGTSSVVAVDQIADTFTASHVYSTGGIFEVIVTLTDDDTGQATATTEAWVTGARVTSDGILQIVGTSHDDHVRVNRQGKNYLNVHTDFLVSGNFERFNADDVRKIIAYLCEGDDHLVISAGVHQPAIVHGGSDNDVLIAGSNPSILLGGLGSDKLIGGTNRDLLIGGEGVDRLVGGDGENVLIGGTTSEDDNDLALMAILAVWTSGDFFDDRVADLVDLWNVFDDQDEDRLTGGSDRDLFYDGLDDLAKNFNAANDEWG